MGFKMFKGIGDESSSQNQINVPKVVLTLLICIFGLFGNLIVITVILILKEYKKSVTHWYVLQLALADLLFLLTLPFKVSEDLNKGFIYPEWMCKAKETILFLNFYASTLFLVMMSIDRYIAICHPYSVGLQKLRRKTTSFIITFLIWMISLLFCIPVMLYSYKIGDVPHCMCSYEFPSHTNQTALCVSGGVKTLEALARCLKLTSNNHIIETGEKYCKPVLFNGLESGGTDINVDISELDFGGLNASEFLKGLTVADYSSSFGDSDDYTDGVNGNGIEDHISVIHDSCNYWERPIGWIAFMAFNFAVMFLFPFIVMIVCYGLIVRRLSLTRMTTTNNPSTSSSNQSTGASGSKTKTKKSSSRFDKNRRRVTIMCATLVGCFVICWLPFHANHLAKIVGIKVKDPKICEILPIVGSLLAYLNSALNPFLYSFIRTSFNRRWKLLKESPMMQYFGVQAARKHIGKNEGGDEKTSKTKMIQIPNQNNRCNVEPRPSSGVNNKTIEAKSLNIIVTVHNEDQIIESSPL